MIKTSVFGKTKEGKEVLAFTFEEGARKAVILNLGGIIQSIIVPDKDGNPTDVVLGYDDVAGYENNGGYLGALIGRYGNRIGGGKLTIDGVTYQLYNNDRGNHLHGGKEGFDKKIWAHEIVGDKLVLSILSPDGEENYPGNLSVKVTYTFKNGEIKIDYEATTDKTTAINLTNHAYFNLNGGKTAASDHLLWIDCDRIVPTNDTMIPVGGFKAVKGTAFDFTTAKPICQDVEWDDIDLKQGGGFDHCHILNNGSGNYKLYAIAQSPSTGIKMSCYTDMPAVHFYAGNGMNQTGKGGVYYGKRHGFCLETESVPNNVNVPEYADLGTPFLKAGEVYKFSAAYKFEA